MARRITAWLRPAQRNVRGATAACLAALTTSAARVSLPTNAEAPASIAAKIWSSPACMVSTTTPVVSLVAGWRAPRRARGRRAAGGR